jgi:hypothetical protein
MHANARATRAPEASSGVNLDAIASACLFCYIRSVMKVALGIVILAVLLLMWRIAWRERPILGLGMTIGVLLAGFIAPMLGDLDLKHIPVWLPALPFATVAVTLLIFGILAWVWDDDKVRARRNERAPPHSH